jgi:hypothetical protein
MTEVVIVSAARTPVGSFLGGLSSLPASKLGEIAIKGALEQAGVDAADVDEVILGHVLQAATGQGPARQAAMGAGIPKEAPAWSLNQICGSGLRAVALGYQQIALGDARIVVAGGQESMSQAPHAAQLRNGTKMGDVAYTDTMIKDGLWDAFNGYHMGQTAENVAELHQITRGTVAAQCQHELCHRRLLVGEHRVACAAQVLDCRVRDIDARCALRHVGGHNRGGTPSQHGGVGLAAECDEIGRHQEQDVAGQVLKAYASVEYQHAFDGLENCARRKEIGRSVWRSRSRTLSCRARLTPFNAPCTSKPSAFSTRSTNAIILAPKVETASSKRV